MLQMVQGQDPGSQQTTNHQNHAQAHENAKHDDQARQMGGQGIRYQQYGANDTGARGGNESHPEIDSYFTSNGATGSSSNGDVGSSSGFGGVGSSSGFGGVDSSSGFGGVDSSSGFGGVDSSSSGMDTTAQSSSTQSGGKRHNTRRNRYIKSKQTP